MPPLPERAREYGLACRGRSRTELQRGTLFNDGSNRVGLATTSANPPKADEQKAAGGKTLLYEFRVELKGTDPLVWRMLQVPHRATLHRLHQILQVAMGWTDSHLYLFHVGGKVYGEPSPEWDSEIHDSTSTTLEEIVSEGSPSFLYEYDLGDSWMHEIRLRGTLEANGEERPRCTGGARACPPEDCGGPPGYKYFLEAISDPGHEEHDAMLEWAGGDFDPQDFDPGVADLALILLA